MSVQLDTNTCQGNAACAFLGDLQGENIHIREDSCIGRNSCRGMGYQGAREISVGHRSCLGVSTCYDLAVWFTRTIELGDDTCYGSNSCRNTASRATSLYMGDHACVGNGGSGHSCRELGHDVNSPDTVILEDYACNGDSTADTDEICQHCYSGVNVASITIPAGNSCPAVP